MNLQISKTIQWMMIMILILVKGYLAQIKVTLTTPVNPVEQGGILSIHCQVFHLNSDNHEVTIIRNTGNNRIEKLSVDEGVLQGVDDRVFLAVRQLMDGSSVYFLSITEATRSDEGEYFCKVLTNGMRIEEVASESVHLGMTYFPDDSDPVCLSPDQPYMEGSTVILNCSSVTANPPVSLEWTSGKARSQSLQTREFTRSERSYSMLTLTLQRGDNGEIFVCHMTSIMFPDRVRTCHIGPLVVYPTTALDPVDPNIQTNVHHRPNELTTLPLDTRKQPTNDNINSCQETCSVKSRVIYWMIATVIAGAFSLIFFIFAIALLVKYIRAPTNTRSNYITARQNTEDIYSELECSRRLGEGKVYMSLDKSATKPNPLDSTAPTYGFHYHDMPTVVKVSTPK